MKKPVVLVVDDEAEVRTTLIEFLGERYECAFHEAADGEEAVDFVKAHPCDMILLDIKMPKKSGMSVIPEVKQIDPLIDILVVSAWVSDEVADETTQLGATDYALKPLNLDVISMKMGSILKKRKDKANRT